MPSKRSPLSQNLPRRTWVEIDRAALRYNLKAVRKLAGSAGIIAVVKANGYGHGLNEVAATLRAGVDIFAVASLGEALQLRETEKTKPIMLLSAALPSEYREIGKHGFIPTISSLEEARLFAKNAPKDSPVNFKINTGMGRLGALPKVALESLKKFIQLPLTLHSLSTHLPSADSHRAFTLEQLKSFKLLLHQLRAVIPNTPIHLLNSAGTMLFPQYAHNFVRIGLALYGVSPVLRFQKLLRPALSWKAVITLVQEIPTGHPISYGNTYITPRLLRVAVIPAGYADGYPRQLSGRGAAVLIQGKRCPLLGLVTMDQIMVDISHLKKVQPGEEVVLLGEQKGRKITATEIAKQANTIPWHLFCGITGRVSYFYKN
jgi:alanine racemase